MAKQRHPGFEDHDEERARRQEARARKQARAREEDRVREDARARGFRGAPAESYRQDRYLEGGGYRGQSERELESRYGLPPEQARDAAREGYRPDMPFGAALRPGAGAWQDLYGGGMAYTPEPAAYRYEAYRREQEPHGHERGFWDRATDEVASWFGDEDAEHRREEDHRGRGPRGYKRSDARIEEDVNDRLTEDRMVDASDIEVTVEEREVTLSGHVASRQAKRRAEDCAESVSGVEHVQNNLRVKQFGGQEIAAS